METYKRNLGLLVGMWGRCKAKKPYFRAIFKLISAPGLAKCKNEWGFNTDARYMAVANEVARRIVEEAGFEVFDAFPVTFHAENTWMDDQQHSDTLSDLLTQVLLNQLCRPGQSARRVTMREVSANREPDKAIVREVIRRGLRARANEVRQHNAKVAEKKGVISDAKNTTIRRQQI